jgi:ABC-type Fe3+/spermidine/putrescine transport system ATPase subunit
MLSSNNHHVNVAGSQESRASGERTDLQVSNVLEVQNLSHSFPDLPVLTGVSFAVPAGSSFFILGRSGEGKTTLLRIIAGLLRPSSGRVLINGVDARTIPTHKRDIGFVFQSEKALFPHLSVHENIAFPFKKGHRKPPHDDWRVSVNRIINDMGLQGHAKDSISTLSGGLKQRVSIARALVYQPSVLLLDEPLNSLDNPRKDELLALLDSLKTRKSTTIIYVTHDDREVRSFATHVAILSRGEIEQTGTKEEVIGSPSSAIVRQLLKVGGNSS